MQEVLEFIISLLNKIISIIFNIPKIKEIDTIMIFISTGGIVTIIGILAFMSLAKIIYNKLFK